MSTAVIDFEMNFEENQQAEADKRLLVRFFSLPIHQEYASIEAGRPIYKDVDHVSIIAPGSRNEITNLVDYGVQQRFPAQWARYKAGKEQTIDGTPLSALAWMSPSQITEFAALNVKTVEGLVGVPDAIAHMFMGFQQIKQRAQLYLDSAKDAAPMLKLQSELEKRDEQIAELRGMIEAMKASQAKVPLKA